MNTNRTILLVLLLSGIIPLLISSFLLIQKNEEVLRNTNQITTYSTANQEASVVQIVGPGSPWVAAAKRLLAHIIDTGSPAGPSELIVLADDTVDAINHRLDLYGGEITASKERERRFTLPLRRVIRADDPAELVGRHCSTDRNTADRKAADRGVPAGRAAGAPGAVPGLLARRAGLPAQPRSGRGLRTIRRAASGWRTS